MVQRRLEVVVEMKRNWHAQIARRTEQSQAVWIVVHDAAFDFTATLCAIDVMGGFQFAGGLRIACIGSVAENEAFGSAFHVGKTACERNRSRRCTENWRGNHGFR